MKHVMIIAEAGVNHNGQLSIAKRLVDAAKDAGADVIKFQTFDVDSITSKYAEMAQYQKENIGEVKSQKDMLSNLVLSHDDFKELYRYCEEKGIRFLSTPFDIPSIEFLKEYNGELWKIPSGEITNYPYLIKVANMHQEVILSTGMSTLDEVKSAVEILMEHGAGKISLLHCTTQYPTLYCDVNLKAMKTLKDEFNVEVGYSDHTEGIEIPLAAVGMGAAIIEKHFTLDRTMQGPDHKASLEPHELKAMVLAIRNIEQAWGNGEKCPQSIELQNKDVARKSIVAKTKISKGEILTETNITTKRPGNGLSPMLWERVIGTKAVRDFGEDELIEI